MAGRKRPAPPPPPPRGPKKLDARDLGEADEHIDVAALAISALTGFASNPDRAPSPKGIFALAQAVLDSEEDWPEDIDHSEDGEDVWFDLLCSSVQAVCARAPADQKIAPLVNDAVEMATNMWSELLITCAGLDSSSDDDEDGEDEDEVH